MTQTTPPATPDPTALRRIVLWQPTVRPQTFEPREFPQDFTPVALILARDLDDAFDVTANPDHTPEYRRSRITPFIDEFSGVSGMSLSVLQDGATFTQCQLFGWYELPALPTTLDIRRPMY